MGYNTEFMLKYRNVGLKKMQKKCDYMSVCCTARQMY